ncbi:glutaredoxin family protein [Motiliproteus sp. SC1-56]|uniref:glutaredoxin family protein n=1 Tax=Motiliproteus sp. SC1-56 TaxID=2799565 RepID=UPI001A8FB1F5|nr:glutaredoxin family protein [Motiliproteus sp. SC1-56]
MRTLTFYTTSGCHLCELAEAMICATLDLDALSVEAVDIADSDDLIDRYGTRIPVLQEGARELGWPFDQAQLTAFVNGS